MDFSMPSCVQVMELHRQHWESRRSAAQPDSAMLSVEAARREAAQQLGLECVAIELVYTDESDRLGNVSRSFDLQAGM